MKTLKLILPILMLGFIFSCGTQTEFKTYDVEITFTSPNEATVISVAKNNALLIQMETVEAPYTFTLSGESGDEFWIGVNESDQVSVTANGQPIVSFETVPIANKRNQIKYSLK